MLATWAGKQGAGSSLIAAPFATVLASDGAANVPDYVNGWAADYSGAAPAISNPIAFNVTRKGFTGTDSATTDTHAAVSNIVDTLYVTANVRAIFSGSTTTGNWYNTFQTSRVALSDYIYSTDTVAGAVTNNSTVVSPVPICNWATPHRQVVGNTLSGEIIAAHRDARSKLQVACVVVSATDGTHTVTCTVATPTISTRTSDQRPVIVYAWSLDITTLTDAHLVTVNAKVYPWIGADPASVADSSLVTYAGNEWTFSPRYYLKNTTLAAAPVYTLVSTGGNDATGVFSTTQATAIATPFLTVRGMIDKIVSGATGSPGQMDGVVVLIDSGTFALNSTTTSVLKQNVACLTFTRKPGVARASAIITFGVANFRPRITTSLTSPLTTGCVRFNDIQVTRTGNSAIQGEAANNLEMQWDDVNFDNASSTFNVCSNSAQYVYGMAATALAGSVFGTSGGQTRIARGISGSGVSLDGRLVLGNALSASTVIGTGNNSGVIVGYTTFLSAVNGSTIAIAQTGDVSGIAVLQNVMEFIGTSPQPMLRITGDGDAGNVSHIVLHNNTLVGYIGQGKANIFYDEGATRRYTRLVSMKGTLIDECNVKGDIFVGLNNNGTPDPTEAPWRIANDAFVHGVGCQGNVIEYGAVLSTTLYNQQQYNGMGTLYSTSQTVPAIANSKFTNYQATTWSGSGTTPTAGAGGGTYSWGSSSAAAGIVSSAVLNYDLAGTARAAVNDSASAYVSP